MPGPGSLFLRANENEARAFPVGIWDCKLSYSGYGSGSMAIMANIVTEVLVLVERYVTFRARVYQGYSVQFRPRLT